MSFQRRAGLVRFRVRRHVIDGIAARACTSTTRSGNTRNFSKRSTGRLAFVLSSASSISTAAATNWHQIVSELMMVQRPTRGTACTASVAIYSSASLDLFSLHAMLKASGCVRSGGSADAGSLARPSRLPCTCRTCQVRKVWLPHVQRSRLHGWRIGPGVCLRHSAATCWQKSCNGSDRQPV